MRNDKRSAQDPPVIYLPSSGGFGGSRITPELITRRRFPFRRYSFQEDGSLIAREKNVGRDARSRPYTKPTVRFDTPPPHRASTPFGHEFTSTRPALTSTPTSTSNPTLTVELLKNLVPALVEDPDSFEESISSIFAAHNIDQSIMSAVTQAARRRSSSRPLERTRTLDRSTPSLNVPPSTSAASVAVSLVPFKNERSFPSGIRGATIWYTTQSYSNVLGPPSGIPTVVGNLYIHRNLSDSTQQIWMFGREARWTAVSNNAKVNHPTIVDRTLSIRSDGSPNWVTAAGFANAQHRKSKGVR